MRARPTQVLPYLLAFAFGLGTAGLTACGGENKAMIPATSADGLKADLDAVLSAVDSHDCSASAKAIAQVKADLLELPAGTSKRLQQKLKDGVDTLERQADKECEETTTATTAPTTTATVPTTTTAVPEPTTTATTPVETTPVETTPVETTPADTTPVETTPDDTGGVPTP